MPGEEGRLHTYVDDPILALKGSRGRRCRLAVRFCAALLALRIKVAFNKAQLSSEVAWIGITLSISPLQVIASVPPEKLEEIIKIINSLLNSNVAPIRVVRSLAGKLMNIASLVVMWRPFLSNIWGSLSQTNSRAPNNCVWVKQFRFTLLWIREFILGANKTVSRLFHVHRYFGSGHRVIITTDASPWGLGGFLTVDGQIVDFFSDAISDFDNKVLDRVIG